ncbi:MAG: hypothetical protein ACTSWP_12420 [Candidatus Freyarchaeota archaeon]
MGGLMGKTVYVQTYVDEATYRALKSIALADGRSIRVVRKAIEKYVEDNRGRVEEAVRSDPIWKAVGVIEVEEDASEKDDWSCLEWQPEGAE